MKQILALFDFDGTLTKHDSLFLFIRFVCPVSSLIIHFPRALQIFMQYKIGFLSNHQAKEHILKLFLKNKTKTLLNTRGKEFINYLSTKGFRKGALECITRYRQSGARVIIVSASPEEWIAPFSHMMDAEFIATKLEYKNNLFTGKIAGKNCYGIEKNKRIMMVVQNLSTYEIHAYGDSKGDFFMLSLAQKKYYKPFRKEKNEFIS